jgi:hypothetical protein
MRDGKTYVLEIGGRSGATCLAELTAIYYDFDYYEKILLTALGEDVDFTPGPLAANGGVPNASKLLMSDRDGHIVSQEDSNPADPDVYFRQQDICSSYDRSCHYCQRPVFPWHKSPEEAGAAAGTD